MEDSGALRGFDWEGAKDITALSEGTSGRCCGRLHGREVVRAELAGRGPASPAASPAASPEDLVRILLGGFSEEHS